MQDLADVASVSARLEAVLSRLAGRFRSMPESKLLGLSGDGRVRAAAGHELAGLVALVAQGVEERGRSSAPLWRLLPFDGVFVVGDQIGVTGHDLVAACARAVAGGGVRGGAVRVWAPEELEPGGGRVAVEELLGRVLGAAEELGRGL